jgi:beta-lactamase class A
VAGGRLAHRPLTVRMAGLLAPLRAASVARVGAIRWSAAVVGEGGPGSALDRLDADEVLPTASIGKVFLLITTLDQIERGLLDGAERVPVEDVDRVADSGLLQFLDGQTPSVLDLCRFVGAVSDNLATNVLLRRVGLDRVTEMTAQLGIRRSALHDVVRDVRSLEHAPFLSTGCAAELAALIRQTAHGETVSQSVSAGVVELLRLNTDLSMVASAFGLDPLAHVDADLGVRVFNKTGTQNGTRADIGWVEPAGQGSGVAYAVIARFEDSREARRSVLDGMRAVGERIVGIAAYPHASARVEDVRLAARRGDVDVSTHD